MTLGTGGDRRPISYYDSLQSHDGVQLNLVTSKKRLQFTFAELIDDPINYAISVLVISKSRSQVLT